MCVQLIFNALPFSLESVCFKPDIQNGSVDCFPSDDTGTLVAVGGHCYVQCNNGPHTGTIQCLSNGLWSCQVDCTVTTANSEPGTDKPCMVSGNVTPAYVY